ncbi:MAG: alpha/beta hydrolase [bacterium]|nr:alpha/beta hydrolase [bacterium]
MRILDPIPLPVDGTLTPLSEGNAPELEPGGEPHNQLRIRNVTVPTITPVLPDNPCGSSVIIAPGGGWHKLSVESEGTWVAEALAERGVASFVLHYRLEPTPRGDYGAGWSATEASLADPTYMDAVASRARSRGADDGAAAFARVRELAPGLGLDPDRVGILGFSAGGHTALATTCDRPEARPSFVGAIYPVAWEGITPPDPVPPLFLVWATDDGLGRSIVDSSLVTYRAWWAAGGVAEAHAYATGGHGFGSPKYGTESDRWMDDLVIWMERRGISARA